MKVSNCLTKCDFLGITPSLSVKNGDSTYQTTIGGINSILILVCILLLFIWYMIYTMIFNPLFSFSVTTQFDNILDSDVLNLGKDTNFAFSAVDVNYKPIILDPRIVNISIVTTQFDFNSNRDSVSYNQYSVSAVPCDFTVKNDFISRISRLSQYQPLCFQDQTKKINIGGDIVLNNTFYYNQIVFEPTTVTKNTPSLLNTYNEIINNINLIAVTYMYKIPQPTSFQDPVINNLMTYYLENMNTTYQFLFQTVSFLASDSLAMGSPVTNSWNLPSIKSADLVGKSGNPVYGGFNISLNYDNSNLVYSRQVWTFDLYLNNFITYAYFIYFIFLLINLLFLEKPYYLYLIKKFFGLKNVERIHVKQDEIIVNDQPEKFHLKPLKSFENSEDHEILIQKFKKHFDEVKEIELNTNVFKILCCCGKKETNTYELLSNVIRSFVSIENVIAALSDLKRLKKVVFNMRQEKIFDHFFINDYAVDEVGVKPSQTNLKSEDFNLIKDIDKTDSFERFVTLKLIALMENDVNNFD